MSGDLTQSLAAQIIALEQRVRALEDAKVSYIIGDVNVKAQAEKDAISKMIDEWWQRNSRPGGIVKS